MLAQKPLALDVPAGTRANEIEHLVLYDFSVHWIDITRCWVANKAVVVVQAREYRTPNQPPESASPWGAWVVVEYEDGTSAVIRSVGSAETQLTGEWLPDGFAGAMGELLSAIAEDREPFNSARHNLLSLQMTLAACRSAEQGGRTVTLDEIPS